jgi:hypothetical protein
MEQCDIIDPNVLWSSHKSNWKQSGRMCFMAYRLDVRKQRKGTCLIIQKKHWDKRNLFEYRNNISDEIGKVFHRFYQQKASP